MRWSHSSEKAGEELLNHGSNIFLKERGEGFPITGFRFPTVVEEEGNPCLLIDDFSGGH